MGLTSPLAACVFFEQTLMWRGSARLPVFCACEKWLNWKCPSRLRVQNLPNNFFPKSIGGVLCRPGCRMVPRVIRWWLIAAVALSAGEEFDGCLRSAGRLGVCGVKEFWEALVEIPNWIFRSN